MRSVPDLSSKPLSFCISPYAISVNDNQRALCEWSSLERSFSALGFNLHPSTAAAGEPSAFYNPSTQQMSLVVLRLNGQFSWIPIKLWQALIKMTIPNW